MPKKTLKIDQNNSNQLIFILKEYLCLCKSFIAEYSIDPSGNSMMNLWAPDNCVVTITRFKDMPGSDKCGVPLS